MICNAVQKLIDYAIKNELITIDDMYVVRNQLMEALKLTDWTENDAEYIGESIDEILAPMITYACENGIISDTANSRDLFDTKLMGILTPMPREVIAEFKRRYAAAPKEATDRYFDFSKKLNYVRAGRIAKDLKWEYPCEYGTLDITINCSKPEKDPRDIAAAKTQKASAYPKCQLCPENAGFAGHSAHPARQNLRPIPMTVNGEKWQLQYSPYGYYNEHCIAFNEAHVPMKIDALVFGKLFDIVDYLPHYIIGSNADLPIVGGSILSHEHFQGGNYTFAMAKAPIEHEFSIKQYPDVKAGIVKWPMSVIRVSSENREELAKCCNHILETWRAYSDESVGIFAETDGEPHNTITPIARKNGDFYECDLVLRNNITTEDHPLGVFHPNPSLHHIKKENIGLIEVMGLAVLPARLAKEIALLEDAMLSGENLYACPELTHHAEWAEDILKRYPDFNKENARAILEQEIGKVFLEVLEDVGVFKRNDEGTSGFLKFIQSL
ncbi:MAG: UDP-glucose--hexose-1-phosphate uridylyltransferase [Oscillospiraceae bacterium]|nr:UDP-glucose--hexose-1-phosphate uridylyltransferase [Oscillospiraceae bacterium]